MSVPPVWGDAEIPMELDVAIMEFWPMNEWDNARGISWLESKWDAFAVNDTTRPGVPCGAIVGKIGDILVVAEHSVGYFAINTCNYPDWEWQRLYNARHNAGTAHMLWDRRGWAPWLISARKLGLA